MRRGLMAWDRNELPLATLTERIERLQTAMAEDGQDALILYTNFIRSAAVSYLTGFSPYWADGVLLAPRRGDLVFATTLSKRVASWIQSVKPVGDLINSPRPAAMLGERLAGAGGIRRVAILELDDFPSGLYDELAAAMPGVEIVDGSETFARMRGHLDAIERRLLESADAIAQNAFDRLTADAPDVGAAVGAVEMQARFQGAEEVYVAAAPDLDADRRFVRLSGGRPLGRRFAIRMTVAYKGAWVRRTRTYAREGRDSLAIRRADAWFKTLLSGIDANRPLRAQVAAGLRDLPPAQLVGWTAEASVGTRPLAIVASSENPGEALERVPASVLSVALNIDGIPWCGAGLAAGGTSA